ncbi:hypothetical protein D3C76_881760 [compost metagenome]
MIAAVLVIGRDARQGRYLPAVKLAQFGQINQQTGGSHRADPFNGGKPVGFFCVQIAHALIDGLLEQLDLRLQVANMIFNRRNSRWQLNLLKTTFVVIPLLDEVLAQLNQLA